MKSSNNSVVLIVGTRPEGIKIAPLYHAFKKAQIPVFLCSTAQHTVFLNEVFGVFGIEPDISFDIMRPGQDVFYITQIVLQKMKLLLHDIRPRVVIVQGDTTSSMAGALGAFYGKVPVAHVEAGLRTGDIYAPFPEEINRRIISTLATHHFAPTDDAVKNLMQAGVEKKNILMTGNTGIDAVHMIIEKIAAKTIAIRPFIASLVEQCHAQSRIVVLFTVHRRELWDFLESIFDAIKKVLQLHENLFIIYPHHYNPLISEHIKKSELHRSDRLFLCDALPYHELLFVMQESSFVITDSGGIQEEAATLRKPFIVLREKTERQEGVRAGRGFLVGTKSENIIDACSRVISSLNSAELPGSLLSDRGSYDTLYGDGHAAERIVNFINDYYYQSCNVPDHHADKNVVVMPMVTKMQADINTCLIQKGNRSMEKIVVIGLGYIGLPTAILTAEAGYEVIGYDTDKERVMRINSADPVIYEPEIYERLSSALSLYSFKAVTVLETADFYIIAVPTPLTVEKKADLTAVFSAAHAITLCIKKGQTVIIESTVPVGTTEKVARYIEEQTGFGEGTDFCVAYCPERVLPGNIFNELIANHRVVGVNAPVAGEKVSAFYQSFVRGNIQLVEWAMAELVKLTENSYRDVQIAFAHQMAQIARTCNVSPYQLIEYANKHPRISILKPTCGVGGHCLAVDPWFLAESHPDLTPLIQAARCVNDDVRYEVLTAIDNAVSGWHKEKGTKPSIAILGLAYKPNVDDMRESPALAIARLCALSQDRVTIVFDPHCIYEESTIPGAQKKNSLIDCTAGADIIVFLVAHTRFFLLDNSFLEKKIVIDFCGIMYEKSKQQAPQPLFKPASSALENFLPEDKKNRIFDSDSYFKRHNQ